MENNPTERRTHPSLFETPEFRMIIGACALLAIYWVVLTGVYYMTNVQAAELTVYLLSGAGIPAAALYLYTTRRSRREQRKVHPPVVLGMTGSGKTTLLKNIITQDLVRRTGPPEERHKIPLMIFDGKGDLEFFQELLAYIHRAGRLSDLRLINPARRDLSSLYNPFYVEDDD
jgi:type VI protein secretion system component VasK